MNCTPTAIAYAAVTGEAAPAGIRLHDALRRMDAATGSSADTQRAIHRARAALRAFPSDFSIASQTARVRRLCEVAGIRIAPEAAPAPRSAPRALKRKLGSYRFARGSHGSAYAIGKHGVPFAPAYRLAASRCFANMGRIVMSGYGEPGPLHVIRLADLEG